MMTGFIGIWIWAWLPRHRRQFDQLAQLPMEDRPTQADPALTPVVRESHR
ncbi:MAG: cbb3-type cytochrome c oxidase subunit 3 [Sinobacteraceae bacterium]|nr:cbb3-type cytochrome c oxidase subunit 3 [Nevskiaceae bacterium]MCP5360264.1 cbb3-type cytochrome c oxidase subunit 3 [Nevskiaceae bacterium]MCP5466599.1 cbb3-type cytochrome c oxidase subunit 3 [Nevskiaceae bacterium]